MIPEQVRTWLADQGHGQVLGSQPVAGGCINNGAVLQTETGASFFLKTNKQAPEDMFAREAEGLSALRGVNAVRVPGAYLWAESFLLLEDLRPAAKAMDYWERMGEGLAQQHSHEGESFGFEHDNYIGSTPQPNPLTGDGYEFFGQHRLLHQARLARDKDFLARSEATQIERLAARLPELIPEQPASLLHGDLWAGNAISDGQGLPALIDPAAHYGWAEAELAMTTLFGGFDERFYSAYKSARRLDRGWRERVPIYNLYHLLNHLNLFGADYHSQVRRVLAQTA